MKSSVYLLSEKYLCRFAAKVSRWVLSLLAVSLLQATAFAQGRAVTAREASNPAQQQYRVLLTPVSETTLSSPQMGRIAAIQANMGDSFNTGQVLIKIDCQDHEARIDVFLAELAGAVETHEAKLRMMGLQQASDVEVALAAASVQKIKAEIKLLQQQIARCSVSAPWPGRVSKIHVRTHMTVNAGEPLIDLVRSGPLLFRVNLPSELAGKVRSGHKIMVQVDETGQSYEGALLRTTARVDPVSQTIEGEGRLLRVHAELLPGMSGQALLDVSQK